MNTIKTDKNPFRQTWINAQMQFGGNWTTDGSLMVTSLYSDLRMTGSWPPPPANILNTTGKSDHCKIVYSDHFMTGSSDPWKIKMI